MAMTGTDRVRSAKVLEVTGGAVEKVSHRGRGMGKGDLSLTDVILVV